MVTILTVFISGLQNRQRKSALWHYLYKFGRQNEKNLRFKGTMGCQAYCVPLVDTKPYILPDHSRPVQVEDLIWICSFKSRRKIKFKMFKNKTLNYFITRFEFRPYNRKVIRVCSKMQVQEKQNKSVFDLHFNYSCRWSWIRESQLKLSTRLSWISCTTLQPCTKSR